MSLLSVHLDYDDDGDNDDDDDIYIYIYIYIYIWTLTKSVEKKLELHWELHKNAMSHIGQILEVTSHKAAAVQPPTSHL